MNEIWLADTSQLACFGFTGDNRQTTIFIPLSFGLSAANLTKHYKGKVIVQWQHSGKLAAVSVPVIERDRKAWASLTVTSAITQHSGLVTFQYRATNYYLRLLVSEIYKGIVFDAV